MVARRFNAMSKTLTPKQQRFVEEYLIDLNATQAAIRAGYSEKTAHVTGWENLKKPEIAKAVSEAKEERSESTGVTAEMVVKGLLKEASGTSVPDTTASARVSAWEKLGKHLGIFEKDNGQKAPVVNLNGIAADL
jgi:phage terminase small subunit